MSEGFSTKKYLKLQKKAIEERLSKFSGRLYLEFGGKLLDDFHASRVLPGYEPNAKLTLLKNLKKKMGMIYCVSAKQLAEGKVNGNWGMGYDMATIKALEILKQNGLHIFGVVINRFEGETEAIKFKKRLERMGHKVYIRNEIKGYLTNLKLVLSSKGYGLDDYVETDRNLVVVWGAGPGSGKLSTCLGQIYLDAQKGIDSGYAKFETFPIWDLPVGHPVNLAYEGATADLGDFNLIDKFHKDAYGKKAVNYNRDMEVFPLIKMMFEKIVEPDNYSRNYKSPTDMGVNCVGSAIVDDRKVRQGSKKGIILHWFRYKEEYKRGLVDKIVLERMDKIMAKLDIGEDELRTIKEARRVRDVVAEGGGGEDGISCGAAIELADGRLVYGKNSKLLHAEAAVILNAIKTLARIPDEYKLVSKSVIKQIGLLKQKMGDRSASLEAAEVLLALAVSARDNPVANKAMRHLDELANCYIHTSHRPSVADEKLLRKLGMWLTTDGMVEKVNFI